MEKRAVVLLSGGIDSTTMLAIAQSQGYDACAMSFRYGQRHVLELECAKQIAEKMGVNGAAIGRRTVDVRGGASYLG